VPPSTCPAGAARAGTNNTITKPFELEMVLAELVGALAAHCPRQHG